MPTRKGLVLYLAIFALVGAIAGTSHWLGRWGYNVRGCIPYAEEGTFLAYCTAPHYGDYEHGAYYYGLQPRAIENLQKAKVLILGNSRAQFAFSTDVVRRYFNERSIPFHLLGFGYNEGPDFARILIEKYSVRPHVLVIVTDPYFGVGLSEPAIAIVDGPLWRNILAFEEVVRKKIFNALLVRICTERNALCPIDVPTIYRSEQDGMWLWENLYRIAEAGRLPLQPPQLLPRPPGPEDVDINRAKRLLEATRVPPDCVVLTSVPNSYINSEPYTADISRILGASVVFPWEMGLVTIDNSHLTWSSARRWSASFLRSADSLIARCVAQGAAVDKK